MRTLKLALSAIVLSAAGLASAQTSGLPSTPQQFRDLLIANILNPVAALLFGAAMVFFAWGIVEFLMALSSGGDTSQGKQHMLWGIVGVFIMTIAYAILQIVANTFGLTIPR